MTELQKEKVRERNRLWYIVNAEKVKEKARIWYASHTQEVREKKRRERAENREVAHNKDRERKYGITLTVFESMQQTQNGRCAICKQEAAKCVDHNHKTGKVRALLCRKCNSGLGQFKEDFSILIRAADYIRRHEGLGIA